MTDAEFLDELQRRASENMTMFITNGEWKRLGELTEGTPRLNVVPSIKDTWAIEAGLMYNELARARRNLVARVKQRLLGR